MKNLTFKKDAHKVIAIADNQEIAHIEINSRGGYYSIEMVEISEEFRGKGIYKMLLISAINMFGIELLTSSDRNERSNEIYEHWTGLSLGRKEQVNIYLFNEELYIEKDEE